MDSTASVVVAAVVVGLAVWLWRQGRPSHFPPGPLCLPFLGSVLSMSRQPLPFQLETWRKKYGNIFSFSLGSSHFIVLNGYDVIKEALVQRGVEFAGRLGVRDIRVRNYTTNYPILGIGDGTYSEEWKRQRSISLQILRSLGYGKSTLEAHIQSESSALKQALEDTKGRPTNPSRLFGVSVANVICSLLYGERYDHSDLEFRKLIQIVDDIIKYFFADVECDYIWLLSFKPSYKKGLQDLYRAFNDLNDFNEAKFRERHERLQKDGYSEPRDFIERYLCELRNDLGESKLTENWLSGIVNDFFLAGSETSSTTLAWICLWMAARPDVQDKVHAEVSLALEGSHGEVSLALREQCPYTEAAIMEVMRISTVAPMALIHTATADVKFHGYTIEKDTEIFVNLYSVLMDPTAWPDPDQFKPERHLDEGRIVQRKEWIPFSMGRRSCLGEQLAKQEVFLFFTKIVSSFRIRLPEGHKINLEPWDQGVMKPHPYEAIFEPRE